MIRAIFTLYDEEDATKLAALLSKVSSRVELFAGELFQESNGWFFKVVASLYEGCTKKIKGGRKATFLLEKEEDARKMAALLAKAVSYVEIEAIADSAKKGCIYQISVLLHKEMIDEQK